MIRFKLITNNGSTFGFQDQKTTDITVAFASAILEVNSYHLKQIDIYNDSKLIASVYG